MRRLTVLIAGWPPGEALCAAKSPDLLLTCNSEPSDRLRFQIADAMIKSVPLVILNRADVDGLLHDIERETGFELEPTKRCT
jgi:hypothetical protein